jgi:hypothetical protein
MRKRKIKSLKNKKSQGVFFGKLKQGSIYGKILFALGLFGVIFASSLFTFGKIANQPSQLNQSGQDTVFTDPEVEKVAREVLGDKVVDVLNEDNTAENQKLLALTDEIVAQQENGEEVKIAFENKSKKGLWGNLLTSLIGKSDISRDEEELRREIKKLDWLKEQHMLHLFGSPTDDRERLLMWLEKDIRHQRSKIEAIQKRINDKRMQPLKKEVHSYEIEISKNRQKIEQMERKNNLNGRDIGHNAFVNNEKIQISQNRRCPLGSEWHPQTNNCIAISINKAHCESGGGIWHGSLQTGTTGCTCIKGYYWNGSGCVVIKGREKTARSSWIEKICKTLGPGDHFIIDCN